MKQYLIDANIIIGAKDKNSYCLKILKLAETGQLVLVTTKEISKEVPMPTYVRIITISKKKKVSYDWAREMKRLQKLHGNDGKREEPSDADKSLVLAYQNGYYSGIISDDQDISFLVLREFNTDSNILYMSKEFINRRAWI